MPEIIPRSEEHQELRHRRITGSKIHTVVNGTYKGWTRLSKLMHGPTEKFYTDVAHMPSQLARGVIWEPVARNDLWDSNPELDVTQPAFLTPEMFGRDFGDITEWMGYSPDAKLENMITGEEELLEIKTQDGLVWNKWGDRCIVNPYNITQCQYGLLITGWKDCWYRCFNVDPTEGAKQKYFDAKILPDHEFHDLILIKLAAFVEVHKVHGEFLPPNKESADVEALKGL